jgi:cytochrome c oxidase assembly protein subunit 15
MIAYAIWLVAALHVVDAVKRGTTRISAGAAVVGVLVTAQATLGIVTLLYVAPLGLSLAHQALAIVVLTAAVVHAESLRMGARMATIARDYSLDHGARTT